MFVTDLWVSVLECQIDCESRLSTFDETNTDFLPELYNYLQFSYYKGTQFHTHRLSLAFKRAILTEYILFGRAILV